MRNFIFLYYYNRKYNNYYFYIYYLFFYFIAKTFTEFIPNNKNTNNNLSQQLNDERIKNIKLEGEIQKLRSELSKNKKIKKMN